jgi:hypothetical protein
MTRTSELLLEFACHEGNYTQVTNDKGRYRQFTEPGRGRAPYWMTESISEAPLRLWVSGAGEPHCGGCAHGRFRNLR